MRQWPNRAVDEEQRAVGRGQLLLYWNVGAIYKKVAGTLQLGALGPAAAAAANSFHLAESCLVRLPAAFSAIGSKLV